MDSARRTVHVAAGIVHRDGRVLAAHRADGAYEGGWELPGGKVEEGEAPVEALRRELSEELGCELGSAWLYDTVEHAYPHFPLPLDGFVRRRGGGAAPACRPGVHDELRWLSRDELMDVAWLPADVELARGLVYYWDEALADQLL